MAWNSTTLKEEDVMTFDLSDCLLTFEKTRG